MTQYCYVRDHADGIGSRATTAVTTIQTGDWDTTLSALTDYYISISAAVTNNTLVAGDFIICSDIHSHQYGANIAIALPSGVIVTSVDDTAIDVEKTGAAELATGAAYDYQLTAAAGAHHDLRGMSLTAGDELRLTYTGANTSMIARACTFACVGTSNYDQIVLGSSDGNDTFLYDTILQVPNNAFNSTTEPISLYGGRTVTIDGGSLALNSTKPTVFIGITGLGGGRVVINNFDFTNMDSTGQIVNDLVAADDSVSVLLTNCVIPSGVAIAGTIGKLGQRVEAYSVDSADNYFQMDIKDYFGDVVTETTIVRSDALTYDGTNRISLKATPANTLAGVKGLKFNLPAAVYTNLTTSKTVTVYLLVNNIVTTATALTDQDVVVRIARPDGTNQALGIIQESGGTSILKAGTALTTSSKTWDGDDATNAKQYEIAVVIPSGLTDVTDGRVTVEVEVMADGLTTDDALYICPDIDVA